MRAMMVTTTGVMIVAPSAAMAADRLTGGAILTYAMVPAKLIMGVLVLAAIAAVIVTVRKMTQGRNIAGGSAYIAALRLGGPLIGLLGAALTIFDILIALANMRPGVPFAVLTPGLAEGMLVLIVGLITGIVAVVCHAIVEARIDRAVLQS